MSKLQDLLFIMFHLLWLSSKCQLEPFAPMALHFVSISKVGFSPEISDEIFHPF